ncbi:lipopolysaccharide-induced tumor necrosis factor-alpha factor homolog [Microplitis demolitor]|uniref:lipopolysaccharide-induced tumor necrosis factor-alpha factor homolog n=1 Tax=Microplitis demolitor TaxID=69319 RepID=UPI00043FFEC1|nr:lipopolysaccharide-induced tumor necrosis factor-alpha factor homolog [Microplitis demolitor]XP_008553919.1 lipopolysaccharide-induced tumor necrosis factor-alpha factor homolog [Microplitis demolitor]
MDKQGVPHYDPGVQPPPPGFAPPPPYSSGPQPPPQAPGVIFIQQTTFGPDTMRLSCPHCQHDISTRVETEASTKTHLFALLLCLLGCWCCAPCPYCMDSCLVKKHYCPSCKQYLGSYEN